MIKLRCLRAAGHENKFIHTFCYVLILLQKKKEKNQVKIITPSDFQQKFYVPVIICYS